MIYFITLIFIIIFYKLINDHIKNENEIHKNNLLFIDNYKFPSNVIDNFKDECTSLKILVNNEIVHLTEQSLKQYFKIIYIKQKFNIRTPYKNNIGMPSLITDLLWHSFIENKDEYSKFCKTFLYDDIIHVKNEKTEIINKVNVNNINTNVLNTVYILNKFRDYDISLTILNSIPILFSIDNYLKINNGYYYNLSLYNNIVNKAISKDSSASSDGSGSFSGSDADNDSGSSCGSSCSGGCGGD